MRFCYSCMRQIADNAKDICPYCKEKLNIEYNADMCLKPGYGIAGKVYRRKTAWLRWIWKYLYRLEQPLAMQSQP